METTQLEEANIKLLPDWQQEKSWAHLQAWFNENEPSEQMIYKKEYDRQIMFIMDSFMNLFNEKVSKMEVISTHTSKSIKLPVYHAVVGEIDFIIRANFHDWKISVNSPNELKFPLELFSKPESQIPIYYCEGFEKEWIYESYVENNKKFTVEIYNENLVYTFLFLIKCQLENSEFFRT